MNFFSIKEHKTKKIGLSEKSDSKSKIIALAGNPNVGKSSIFNRLTGLKQHTGNWPGKTVSNAEGRFNHRGREYILVDLPGTYSLFPHSEEEKIARDYICFGKADATIVVCDATCLERNMNLLLQTLEITPHTVLCINLMDEAKKHGIKLDLNKLSQKLGIPVIGCSARRGTGIDNLLDAVEKVEFTGFSDVAQIKYTPPIEDALSEITPVLSKKIKGIGSRWLALRLLDGDSDVLNNIHSSLNFDITSDYEIQSSLKRARSILGAHNINQQKLSDNIVSCCVLTAEYITSGCVIHTNDKYRNFDRILDRIFTNPITGIPVMLIFAALIFWLTIYGANLPSRLLSLFFSDIEIKLFSLCIKFNVPEFIYSPLIFGVYRILTRVVAVMFPPMAIFFPLFTLLEDMGYLPRIAFNLDKCFQKCSACGKQALTMCMGIGCNAAGVTGCRIIDSPRERMIAILTNCFIPCNGKFPTLISIITMFFIFSTSGIKQSFYCSLLLLSAVMFSVFITFAVSKILSKTILKGHPSSFTLELPPYRLPKISSVIVRSVFDRTLFVLGRAVCIAAPAGLLIWLFANIRIYDNSLLSVCANFLDPFAKMMGLDGTILFAFVLGFPANEIVVPIIIMSYMSAGTIGGTENLYELRRIFLENGWTWVTAVNMILFSLLHWPCSTTVLTIKKETGSIYWTLLSAILPTMLGVAVCMIFTAAVKLFT